jgi:hypothetical protein
MSWFIIIAMLVLFGINVYIGLRLIRTSVLPKRWAIAAWAFIAVLAFGPPLLFMTGRDKGGPAWQ